MLITSNRVISIIIGNRVIIKVLIYTIIAAVLIFIMVIIITLINIMKFRVISGGNYTFKFWRHIP